MSAWGTVLTALIATAVAAAILGPTALRVGWVDQRSGQEHRKVLRQPTALIGGAVILIGVFLAVLLAATHAEAPLASMGESLSGIAWPGLLGAFLLGLVDDVAPRGLTAKVKFAGQLFVAALVIWHPGSVFADASAVECLGLGLLALVAMNAVNLFDHADGLVGLLGSMAMVAGKTALSPLFAAAMAGYLPFNLLFRRRGSAAPHGAAQARIHSAPLAMLGDSGSHLVGVLLATTPGAWWFLALPLLDMVRVVLKRVIDGRAFWRGDRTHLGHLLHGIGFSPFASALLVGTLLLPILGVVTLLGGWAPLIAGLLSTAALYFGMLVMADHAYGESPVADAEDDLDLVGRHQTNGSPGSSATSADREASEPELAAPAEDPPAGPLAGPLAGPAARPAAGADASSGPFAGPPSENAPF